MIVDKYIMLDFPLKYPRLLTRRNMLGFAITIWVASLTVISIFAIIFNFHHLYSNSASMCHITFITTSNTRKAVTSGFTCSFPILVSYLYCNIKIYLVCQCHRQNNRITADINIVTFRHGKFNTKELKQY